MLAVRLDLVPELEDVHHDDVVGSIAVRLGPDGLIDILNGQHLAPVLEKQVQDFILRIGQPDGPAVHRDLVVHAQHQALPLRLGPVGPLIDPVPPQQGPDPGGKLRRRKGLAQIVIASGHQGRHLLRVAGHGRKKQDRDIAALPDSVADLEAVHAVHHDVQNDQLHRLVQAGQGLGAAVCGAGLEALPLQQDPDDLGDVPVIVDNQYFPRHSPIFSKSLDGLLSHRPPPEPPDGKNFKISRKFIIILTDCMIFQQIAL